MSKSYRDQVLVLKKKEFAEADAIVTLFGRQNGLISAMAKGVRRLHSRKSGNIELFNQIDALLSRGRNFDIISEATTIDSFSHWRQDLSLISLAYYATDITTQLLVEGESQTYIYDRLIEFYAWLGKTKSPNLLARWYEVQLLQALGFWSSDTLESPSVNAIALLDDFARRSVSQVAGMKGSLELEVELERLMRWQLSLILDYQPKTQLFIEQVRETE